MNGTHSLIISITSKPAGEVYRIPYNVVYTYLPSSSMNDMSFGCKGLKCLLVYKRKEKKRESIDLIFKYDRFRYLLIQGPRERALRGNCLYTRYVQIAENKRIQLRLIY